MRGSGPLWCISTNGKRKVASTGRRVKMIVWEDRDGGVIVANKTDGGVRYATKQIAQGRIARRHTSPS